MIHPALRFVIATRYRNRVRSIVRRLKTPVGLLAGIVIGSMVALMIWGSGAGPQASLPEKKAMLASFLAFLFILGVLGGIGQRGLLFSKADLDLVFPGPFKRSELLAYHFIPHHVAGAMIALVYVLLLGGRTMPSPTSTFLGFVLCQMTTTHLTAFAAELSMLVADKVYAKLKRTSIALAILVSVVGLLAVIMTVGEAADVGHTLRVAWDQPWMSVVFYPAVAAGEMAASRSLGDVLVPFLSLVGLAAGSFWLVARLKVDFLENSYVATTAFRSRMDKAKHGLHDTKVKTSARGPRSRIFHGAGAVLWLNALIMRRQLRALLGGVIVIGVMLGLFGRQARDATTVLTVLTMVPLWMALPVGFRIPREQLLTVRQLPLHPMALVGALLAVPTLVPFGLQLIGCAGLAATGAVEVPTALAALPGFLVVGLTLTSVEALFLLQQAEPNHLNFLQTMLRFMTQMIAIGPGLTTLAVAAYLTRDQATSVLVATVVQGLTAVVLLALLGWRFERRELILHET